MKQSEIFATHWKFRDAHGGTLRKKRDGRKARPLSGRDPLHLVFKINIKALPKGLRHPRNFRIIREVVKQYSKRFFVRVEQISIQRDHVHLLVRAPRRQFYQYFFKVVAGQIAQRVTGTFKATYEGVRIWKERPFTRVIKGWKSYRIVRNYIQLNEKEVLGQIPYRKQRLKGLTAEQVQSLWA
ncbi:MAG: transposase [Bdellovibrionota bacterium]